MKKGVIILMLIGIALFFYFICGKSENHDEHESPLLSDAMSPGVEQTRDGGTTITYHQDVEEEQVSGDGADESRPASEDTAIFTLQGDTKEYTYKAINGFKKISMTPDYTGHVANFAGNMASINTSNQESYKHVISIMLPPDVVPGVYRETSSKFMFQFFGSENGKLFTIDVNYPFTLNLNDWEGPGGRARGTFSGQLMANNTGEVITIEYGKFDVDIQ
ncbi:MAG: hypothetical protein JW807_15910 [Spirochaetes bacterium]|nr:hypothetical protein [Spirochaetota bacterium]